MTAVLRRIANAVEHRPGTALLALALLTAVFAVFAAQQGSTSDMGAFAPESELAAANQRITDEFGAGGGSVQVIVDAGAGGDVVTPEGLAAAQAVQELALATGELAPVLAQDTPQAPSVVSFAMPYLAALAEQGAAPADLGPDQLDELAATVLADPQSGPLAGALLSRDLRADAAQARAGLVIVRLAPGVDPAAQADGELALADALAAASFPDGLTVSAVGQHIVSESLNADINAEMPVLLGIAFLLIISILLFTFRRVGDVLVGLGGLLIVIVWTYGIAVLLGPDYLGVTGVMSVISVMIPVLLIGLAIDYAIHLTSRYREEVGREATPGRAAHAAVSSVGGALVLATVTTVVGFLTNLTSPLPPIRDFGLFVAGGVISAFVVMLLLVPATRALVDGRRARRGRLKVPATGASTAIGRVMGRAAMLTEHHPVPTLAVAAVVTLLGGLGGAQVSTTFSQSDFIPAESEVGRLLADVDTLFGGDLDETTHVLVDGDLATPEAANALLAAQAQMDDTAGIRSVGGQAQVSSPVTVVAALAADPRAAEQLAQLGFTPEGFAPDADVDAIYALARQSAGGALDTVLSPDARSGLLTARTNAGQDGAQALRAQLESDVAPLRDAGLTTTVVSEALLLDESLDALTASQTRGMVVTMVIALLVLVAFFSWRERRPLLGVITMIPSLLVVFWVAGSMFLLGYSFNVMTAMVASLAIGIGVPFGIHVSLRFTEDLARMDSIDEAVRETVTHTGGALLGSAATTVAGFGVLAFASLVPMQQFGVITALTIAYSLLASVLIEPACLKLWAQRRQRRDGAGPAVERPAHEPLDAPVA